MPDKGDRVVLLSDEVALSETPTEASDRVVLHRDELARGESTPFPGQDVVLLRDDLAQGPTADIPQYDLFGDTAVYLGDPVTLFVPVENDSGVADTVEVKFFEDGNQIDSATKLLPAETSVTFQTTVVKNSATCRTYSATVDGFKTNDNRVCWMHIRPYLFSLNPRYGYLGDDADADIFTELVVQVPEAESNPRDVTVDITDDAGILDGGGDGATKTIDPGEVAEFDITIFEQDETVADVWADITDESSGTTVETERKQAVWTSDKEETLDLQPLTCTDRIPLAGDSTTLSINATNRTQSELDHTLEFFEGPTRFHIPTKTLRMMQTGNFETDRTKDSVVQKEYTVRTPDETQESNTVTVTWLNMDVTAFELSDRVAKLGNSVTGSIDVKNPTPDDEDVTVWIEEDGAEIYRETKTVASKDRKTFGTSVSEDKETRHNYRAFVNPDSGQAAPSEVQSVEWKPAGMFVDCGTGLYQFEPTEVDNFVDWFAYPAEIPDDSAEHNHDLSMRTSIEVLDDGNEEAISITHGDGGGIGSKDEFLYYTYFSEDHGGYLAKNDPEDAEPDFDTSLTAYQSDQMRHGSPYGTDNDGAIVKFPRGSDIEISVLFDTLGITFWNTIQEAGDRIRLVNNR